MPARVTELLVEGTVVGTPFRKLVCYDLSAVGTMRSLKARLLTDLKLAGAQVGNDCDIVLRNYVLTDYDQTSFYSEEARSCALSDQDIWSPLNGAQCRLITAAPCPRVPIDPAEDSRHAMLAIASRQYLDRLSDSSTVLPLEARVKPSAPTPSAAAAAAAAAMPSSGAQAAAAAPTSSSAELQPFEITVRDFRGRNHCVRVCGNTSVQRLKQGIAAVLGCSVVSHWLFLHKGQPLRDDLDMADHGVTAGCVIDVQLTSQRNNLVIPGAAASVLSAAASSGGSSSGGGGIVSQFARISSGSTGSGGGGSGGASSGGVAGSAAGEKGLGAQRAVQVLLPCGRVVTVTRSACEDAPAFLARVLEAEKAALAAPSRDRAATAAPTAVAAPAPAATRTDPVAAPASAVGDADAEGAEGAADAAKEVAARSPKATAAEGGGLEVDGGAAAAAEGKAVARPTAMMATAVLRASPVQDAAFGALRTRQYSAVKGAVAQKLMALLLAAAAVMMAMAVL